jgi:cytochrome c oxidase subunit 2
MPLATVEPPPSGSALGLDPRLSGSKVVSGPKEGLIALVLNGKQGTAMASFSRLSDVELAAVITFIGNSWANKSGEMVLPAEIKAARK